MQPTDPQTLTATSRRAGLLYVAIIVLGLTSELVLRGPLVTPGDAAATWASLTSGTGALRLSVLADTLMVLADIGLALLMFRLLAHVDRGLALAAMVLRLMQAAVIAASLLALLGVLALAGSGGDHGGTALALIETHAAGYDLGLVFFGVNTVLVAILLARSGLVPRWLPPLLVAAGAVYLAGSTLRILAPDLYGAFEPAYLVAVVAEVSLAVVLLRGLGAGRQAG